MSRHSLVRQSIQPRPAAQRSSLSIALELFGMMLVGGPRDTRRGGRR